MKLTDKQVQIISYLLMALSVVGNIGVALKSVNGMYFWTIASIGWVIYTYKKKEYALTILNVIYTILNIMGIILWS